MLGLVFEIAGERYAIEAQRVAVVLSRPEMRVVPAAPAWIAGLFSRDGAWVPVVDAARLIAAEPTPEAATSRVAVVMRRRGAATRALGILAPCMTRVVELGAPAVEGLMVEGKEFLGPIVLSDTAGVQLLDVDRLVPAEVDRMLFAAMDAEGSS